MPEHVGANQLRSRLKQRGKGVKMLNDSAVQNDEVGFKKVFQMGQALLKSFRPRLHRKVEFTASSP